MSFAKLPSAISITELGSLEGGGQNFPAGTYPVQFIGAECMATANDSDSGKTVLTGRVLDGQYKGGEYQISFNNFHKSEKAAQIGKKELYKVAVCAGLPLGAPLQDLSVLGNRPVMLTMAVQLQNGEPHPKGFTEMKLVTAIDGSKPYLQSGGAPAQQPQQQPTPAPAQQQPAQAAGGWGGAPAQQAPAQSGWGGQPAANQPAQQPAAQGGWGGPAQQPAQSGWGGGSTPAQGGWGG